MAGKSRERGQLIKRGPQKYLIRIYLGRVDGKRKYVSKTINGSKKEADAALVKWLREMDTQEFVQPQKVMTVSDLMDEWLGSKVNVQPSTLKGYQDRVDNQINPYIGFLKLAQVSELRLETLFKRLSETYSYSTVQQTQSALSQAFKLAVRRRYLARNPVLNAQLKRPKRKTKGAERAMSPQEVDSVLRTAEGDRYEAFWHVLLGTGMRPQEAAALRWSDLEGHKVHIRRVMRDWGSRETARWEEEGKTRQSLGSLHLPGSVQAALEEHRARQNRELLRTGVRPDHDWIFLTQFGDVPLIPGLRRSWKALLKRAGVDESYRLYDCRHTHATQLLAADVPLKSIQERLRHSTISTTADIYAAASEEMDSKAASVFDQIRASTASSQEVAIQ